MDKLRKQSDKELAKMERELDEIYREAEKDIAEKWDAYMERAAKRTESLEKALQEAKAKGDPEAIESAEKALKARQEAILRRDADYQRMAKQTAERIADVNEIAQKYVNDQMPRIYAMNYNGTVKEIEKDVAKVGRYSFDLVDERTVRGLLKNDKKLFSQKTIDRAKDEKWNLKAINSQMIQGILQGESIPKIQKRLEAVSTMDKNAAIRSARTMCTTAENNGRLAGMKEAEEKGIVYEKQWMATHDERTRESHQLLDGESVPLDEEFGNGLMYPGDMNGDPEEVYNCRCSMVRNLIGFRKADGRVEKVKEVERYRPTYFEEE